MRRGSLILRLYPWLVSGMAGERARHKMDRRLLGTRLRSTAEFISLLDEAIIHVRRQDRALCV